MKTRIDSPFSSRLHRHGFPSLLAAGLFCVGATVTSVMAQWTTQSVGLKSGWNAVYLHVDSSHDAIAALVDVSPIQEVWLWRPAAATAQFVQSPQEPVDTGTQWKSWKRSVAVNELERLIGGAAYLVRSSADYTWNVKGRPVPPRQQWTATGLNFFGYPTAPLSPPTFDQFFAQAPALRQELQVFYYDGGELGANNPRELFNFMLSSRSVERSQAYWQRAGNKHHTAYGPFEITLSNADGLVFGDALGQIGFRLRNLHPSANSVTLQLLDSESPPPGQAPIAGTPPLLVRGELNLTNLTHGYSGLSSGGSKTFALSAAGQPGSEVEIVLGINRYALGHSPGDLLAGIVRLTDSLGYTQVDLPLSAIVGSNSGLWVGAASVNSVNAYLKTFERTAGVLAATNDGRYIAIHTNTAASPVSRPFSLRLIVHCGESGDDAVLLGRVFHGLDNNTNAILTLREVNLNNALLSSARRISAPHLPWTESNVAWPFSGDFQQGGSLTNAIALAYSDHGSNPFLHTYHPDHDNLNATFESIQPRGYESHAVTRAIVLSLQPPEDDFASLTASGTRTGGVYSETITITGRDAGSRAFTVGGTFTLNRISEIDTLVP